MATDLSAYDAVLKNVYAGKMASVLNGATPLLDRVSVGGAPRVRFDGRQFIMSVKAKRNQAIGARAAGSTSLPQAPNQGNTGYLEADWKPRRNWGVISILQEVIDQTATDSGSFARAADSETQGMIEALAFDINRQAHNDGTGVLARCGVTAGLNVVVLSENKGRPFPFEVGMNVDILVTATGAVSTGAAGRNITAISESAGTITIDGGAVTTDTTFSVYRNGSRNNETEGLLSIIANSGSLGSIDPAVAGNERWAATALGNAGVNRGISELLMQQAYDAPQKLRGFGAKPNFIEGSFGVRQQWFSLLAALKRFPETKTLTGGFTSVPFNGIDFFADPYCPKNTIFFVNLEHLLKGQTTPPKWMDDDGHVLKWDTATGYKAVYYWFLNFLTDSRNAHSVLNDITE